MRSQSTAVVFGLFLAVFFCGTEAFGQKGADTFPNTREIEIGGKRVKLAKTGQAVRKKLVFSVYSVANYVHEEVTVRTAQEIVDVDCPKVLHLIMLRTVSGADMADSLLSILRQNYPAPEFTREAPAFADEAKALADKMRSSTAKNGDHILITHVAGVGLHFRHVGGEEILIRTPAFSRAIWECYFGKHNVGEDVKRGLLSALEK